MKTNIRRLDVLDFEYFADKYQLSLDIKETGAGGYKASLKEPNTSLYPGSLIGLGEGRTPLDAVQSLAYDLSGREVYINSGVVSVGKLSVRPSLLD